MKKMWKTFLATTVMSIAVCLFMGTVVFAETDGGEICTGFTWSYDDGTKTLTIKGEGDLPSGALPEESPWQEYMEEIQFIYLDGITSPGSVKNRYSVDSIQTISGRYGTDITWTLDVISQSFLVNGTGAASYEPWSELYSEDLKSAAIGDGLTEVNWLNGYYIDNLTIGDSCSNYKDYKATNITASSNNPYFSTYDGSVYTKGYEKLLYCATKPDPKLHPDVKVLGAYAFLYNTGSIIVPWGVTTIEENAFEIYGANTQIVLPDTLTSVKNLFHGKDNHVLFICSKSNGVVLRDIGNKKDSFDNPVLQVMDSLAEYYPGYVSEPSPPEESKPESSKPTEPSKPAESSQPAEPSKPSESSKPTQPTSKPSSNPQPESSVSESIPEKPASEPSADPSVSESSNQESTTPENSLESAIESSDKSEEEMSQVEAPESDEAAGNSISWLIPLVFALGAMAAVAAVILFIIWKKK